MKRRTIQPLKKSLKKSFITKAFQKWARKGRRARNYAELEEQYGHVVDRKMIQGSAGLVLEHLNVPKRLRGDIMKVTQELYNMEALQPIIELSITAKLDEIWNYEGTFGKVAAGHVEVVEESLGSLELAEHYFARLNEVLVHNYER